tara:strand:+ start:1965 stop:2087 length:123 start_codon:yes stop_codon:yes gene_type:complete
MRARLFAALDEEVRIMEEEEEEKEKKKMRYRAFIKRHVGF